MVLAHSAIGLVISACQCLKKVTYRKDASELKLNVGASEGRAKPQQTRPLDGPATEYEGERKRICASRGSGTIADVGIDSDTR